VNYDKHSESREMDMCDLERVAAFLQVGGEFCVVC